MNSRKRSGQGAFVFAHRPDLHTLPSQALECEVNLHGGFATDERVGFGHLYYGMPGCGVLRIEPDLSRQELIRLPDELAPLNFHSTKIGQFEGKRRLILPANDNEMVAIVSLEGEVDFVLPRPEFEAYQAEGVPYNPTDTVLVDSQLYIADGYGANYISAFDVMARQWIALFGGKTEEPQEDGKFATAHGINRTPGGDHLAIADRPSARIQVHGFDGRFVRSHRLPDGAWPCGIDYIGLNGRWYGVIGSLLDLVKGRPAPIYIVDAESYEVVSTIRPKEELGIEPVQHLHNVVWHVYEGQLFLVCQSWNPGHYFVLEQV